MAMPEDRTVSFEGFSAPLRGKVRSPASGAVSGALVLAHGRNGDMDEPLVEGLSRRTADLGWWTLRFNFAFADAKGEPSADTSDEIADLREAIAFARRESGAETVTIVGRGLGAWAVVAAATDEDAEDAILLGISYAGQEERRVALERLGEFDVPALIVVGSRSDRVDLPALKAIVDPLPFVQLDVIERADHRLRDGAGRPMLDEVLTRCEAWLKGRLQAPA
ncbi:MAG: hypothetical protein A3K59_00055 [Euryarchaeota archaeon RBG_19FT_COMBO_69_17]|nr:MAG: hypothetical protein A3K59_00055 [Euryarchaeota archaeon RBG_19FT_COMBO_69_17]